MKRRSGVAIIFEQRTSSRVARARLDPERLRGEGGDVALERGALGHDGADDEPFDVLWLQPRHRVEARLARFPDEIAVAGFPHAELRHSRADERDSIHRP